MDPLEIAALIAAGLAIGVYATSVGAGGGFLFTPVLLWRYPDAEPYEIAFASMCLVLASSGLSAVRMARARRIDYGAVGMTAAVSVPAAIVGALGTARLPHDVFAVGFAVLLGGLGLYLIWRPAGEAVAAAQRGWRRTFEDREGNRYTYWIPVRRTLLITGAVGALTALAGIGGGIFFSLIGVRVMHMPPRIAVPVSHSIVTTIAISSLLFHTASRDWGDPLRDVPPLLIGVLLANPLGMRAAAVVNERGLTRLLAAAVLVVAIITAERALTG